MTNNLKTFQAKCDTCGKLTPHVVTPKGDGCADIECTVCHFKYPTKWNVKTQKAIKAAREFPEKSGVLTQTVERLRHQIDLKLLKRDSRDE